MNFIILSLAVWRLTSLLYMESWLDWFRKLLGIEYDEATHSSSYPDNIVGRVFECFWCLSLLVCWVGLLFGFSILDCIGASAVSILIEVWVKRRISR